METRLIAVAVGLLVLAGCSGEPLPGIEWRDFDGQRAYRHVEEQVRFGPRPSGSAALQQTAAYITGRLREYGLTVEEQVFTAQTPRGAVRFCNVIGRTATRPHAEVILLGAHYDTKQMPGIRFVGANDGGSGVAALLEMARVAARQPNLWFVFFDGEEAQDAYGVDDGLWGSRHFVEQLQRRPLTDKVRAMVLLDMVGDANLNIGIPSNSDGRLTQQVFEAARDVGCRDFFGYRLQEILDDHVPFLRAGISAVNMIDYEFGSAPGLNDYWHTEKDTLDKISPRSLEITGRTALRLISRLRGAPGKTPESTSGTRSP